MVYFLLTVNKYLHLKHQNNIFTVMNRKLSTNRNVRLSEKSNIISDEKITSSLEFANPIYLLSYFKCENTTFGKWCDFLKRAKCVLCFGPSYGNRLCPTLRNPTCKVTALRHPDVGSCNSTPWHKASDRASWWSASPEFPVTSAVTLHTVLVYCNIYFFNSISFNKSFLLIYRMAGLENFVKLSNVFSQLFITELLLFCVLIFFRVVR